MGRGTTTRARARGLAGAGARALRGATGIPVHPLALGNLRDDLLARARFAASPPARQAERAARARAATPSEWLGVSREHFGVGALQVGEEILALLELAASNTTRVACEIGAWDAGTSLLMSRALPGLETLVVVDLYVKNRWRLREDVPSGQAIHVVDGDSRHPRTVARVRRRLGGRQIDFLLIDGDHSFEGVMNDFLTYRHLVRPGGLIAFHDIVPVRNPGSGLSAGDVPEAWGLIKPLYPSRELVADREQDGFGIGVVTYDDRVSVEGLPLDSAAVRLRPR